MCTASTCGSRTRGAGSGADRSRGRGVSPGFAPPQRPPAFAPPPTPRFRSQRIRRRDGALGRRTRARRGALLWARARRRARPAPLLLPNGSNGPRPVGARRARRRRRRRLRRARGGTAGCEPRRARRRARRRACRCIRRARVARGRWAASGERARSPGRWSHLARRVIDDVIDDACLAPQRAGAQRLSDRAGCPLCLPQAATFERGRGRRWTRPPPPGAGAGPTRAAAAGARMGPGTAPGAAPRTRVACCGACLALATMQTLLTVNFRARSTFEPIPPARERRGCRCPAVPTRRVARGRVTGRPLHPRSSEEAGHEPGGGQLSSAAVDLGCCY